MGFQMAINSCDPLAIFQEITRIPRASGDEKAMADALVDIAVRYRLEWKRDAANNVLIKKPGQAGGERSSPVVLQAHMDMVYVKDPDAPHQYKDPLELVRDGDFLSAKGTSLGADNGVGMAIVLAVLTTNDLPHPPIESLFTTCEEDGLLGAAQISKNWLAGRRLLNIDGEVEHMVTAGCAGAFRAELTVPVTWIDLPDRKSVRLRLSGLAGGHSGIDINQSRGNANVLMGRVLWMLDQRMDILLACAAGGSHMNTIPTVSEAILCIKPEDLSRLKALAAEYCEQIRLELSEVDSGFLLSLEDCKFSKAFSREATRRILCAYLLIPNGVTEMDRTNRNLVQTSTNLGIVKTGDDGVSFISNPRSSSTAQKEWMAWKMAALAGSLQGSFVMDSSYPAWEFMPESRIRDSWLRVYQELYGDLPDVTVLHGGLEPGFFAEKYAGMDMITVGPDIFDVHSAKERLDIKSLERIWSVVKQLLSRMVLDDGENGK